MVRAHVHFPDDKRSLYQSRPPERVWRDSPSMREKKILQLLKVTPAFVWSPMETNGIWLRKLLSYLIQMVDKEICVWHPGIFNIWKILKALGLRSCSFLRGLWKNLWSREKKYCKQKWATGHGYFQTLGIVRWENFFFLSEVHFKEVDE